MFVIEPNETTMLMIGNPAPDLEVEALMPEERFERLRLGALPGR